ncbi:MAG: hypothetical protein ACK4YP_08150 [Myxococcota bacterium]
MEIRFGLILTLLLACANEMVACAPTVPEAAVPVAAEADDVTRAVTVARAIQADPEHAADALAAAGMTEEELDALLFDIAGDPVKSEAYAAALDGAGVTADATAQNE